MELSKVLNRSTSGISFKCTQLKIIPNNSKLNIPWSEHDISFLKENSDMDNAVVAFLLNRTLRSVEHKKKEYNLTSIKDKTRIEKIVEQILLKLNYEYMFNKNISSKFSYRPDFYIQSLNLIIECQGDYWHANPNIYSEEDLNETQRTVIIKDNLKQQTYQREGYNVLYYWESEMLLDNFESRLISDINQFLPS